jgi:hypothetical protein
MNNAILNALYNTLSFHKIKDKIDMVLEPLQAMIQLALLSTSPIGTKLTIQENILYLQIPNIIQPFSRWYNADKKDDLYFLFQVIKRFIKWYNPVINKNSIMTKELYQLIVSMSIEGLNNLLKTYGTSDSNTVIQVITMYKELLEMDDITLQNSDLSNNMINIDEVFVNITKLYNITFLDITYNILVLIQKEEDTNIISSYIDGYNMITTKNNKLIKEWIKVNLIF